MGDYTDALGRFRGVAVQQFGAEGDQPNLSAGYAAAMLRYLKDVAAKLRESPCEPWKLVGDGIARTAYAAKLAPAARDRLWSWARCVCQAADEEGLPFAPVKPNPLADYNSLRSSLGNPPVKLSTGLGPHDIDESDGPTSEAEPDPADIYVDPELETSAKPKPKKPPTAGDKFNTGLFLLAVIVVASIFHRR